MFENPRRGRQAGNFIKNFPKILHLKSSSEQIFSENWRWTLGAPVSRLPLHIDYPSLRSCPLPIIPLCLSREEGVIFFPLEPKKQRSKKKKKKLLISGYDYPSPRGPFSKYLIWNKSCLRLIRLLCREPSVSIRKKYPLEPRVLTDILSEILDKMNDLCWLNAAEQFLSRCFVLWHRTNWRHNFYFTILV